MILDGLPSVQRDLPWRRSRDPWEILVSELMLQQTQVARVLPKYAAFLDRFPTVESCAGGTVAEVVTLWAGLGYNRRAVNLHRCATAVLNDHGGAIPEELSDLLALPGIGPYTARAILAFAFERDVAVVDTNVGRVLARQVGRQLRPAEVQALADDLVPAGQGWAWNQSILDHGALVCTKRNPACGECAVAASCVWHGEGEDPAVGSAAVSTPQSRFAGSDRQGRGRLVEAMRSGPVGVDDLAAVMGWRDDPGRARRVADTLVTDGLAIIASESFRLPTGSV